MAHILARLFTFMHLYFPGHIHVYLIYIYSIDIHHQHKLQVMTTMSVSYVFALADDWKTPPAQVAEDQDNLGH